MTRGNGSATLTLTLLWLATGPRLVYAEGLLYPKGPTDFLVGFLGALCIMPFVFLPAKLCKGLTGRPANPYTPAVVLFGFLTLLLLSDSLASSLGCGVYWLMVLEGYSKVRRAEAARASSSEEGVGLSPGDECQAR